MLVSHYPNVSLNTSNPPTEMARRDAARRDLFEPVKEIQKSDAGKPAVTDDKARSGNNGGAQVNLYDANGKETETQQAIDNREEQSQNPNDEKGEQAPKQQAEQQEKQEVKELKARDQEVKTHEQAHAAVGGRYAGAASYSYELGPDGKQYAVGGEVQIDISPVPNDPQATIQKMQQVRAAALAPAEPSAADRRIAAEATQQQVQAQAEFIKQNSASKQNSHTVNPATSSGFGVQATQTEISYRVSDINGPSAVQYSQHDTLASSAEMQLRRNVISGFYQRATEPQVRQTLQWV